MLSYSALTRALLLFVCNWVSMRRIARFLVLFIDNRKSHADGNRPYINNGSEAPNRQHDIRKRNKAYQTVGCWISRQRLFTIREIQSPTALWMWTKDKEISKVKSPARKDSFNHIEAYSIINKGKSLSLSKKLHARYDSQDKNSMQGAKMTYVIQW